MIRICADREETSHFAKIREMRSFLRISLAIVRWKDKILVKGGEQAEGNGGRSKSNGEYEQGSSEYQNRSYYWATILRDSYTNHTKLGVHT